MVAITVSKIKEKTKILWVRFIFASIIGSIPVTIEVCRSLYNDLVLNNYDENNVMVMFVIGGVLAGFLTAHIPTSFFAPVVSVIFGNILAWIISSIFTLGYVDTVFEIFWWLHLSDGLLYLFPMLTGIIMSIVGWGLVYILRRNQAINAFFDNIDNFVFFKKIKENREKKRKKKDEENELIKQMKLNSLRQQKVISKTKYSNQIYYPKWKYYLDEAIATPDAKCAICKLNFEEKELTYQCLKCYSLFHKEHLLIWIKENKYCPVCKKEYSFSSQDLE